jgi:hypothetical protein
MPDTGRRAARRLRLERRREAPIGYAIEVNGERALVTFTAGSVTTAEIARQISSLLRDSVAASSAAASAAGLSYYVA